MTPQELKEAKNTNMEIWRKVKDDYYAPCIFITKEGAIGINVGGYVKIRPVEEWHKVIDQVEKLTLNCNELIDSNNSLRGNNNYLKRKVEELEKENIQLKQGICEHVALNVLDVDCELCKLAVDHVGYPKWVEKAKELEKEVEQLRVQLAGCGVAALGYAKDNNDCKKGDYGWSASFEDCKNLWKKYTDLLSENKKLREGEQ